MVVCGGPMVGNFVELCDSNHVNRSLWLCIIGTRWMDGLRTRFVIVTVAFAILIQAAECGKVDYCRDVLLDVRRNS